MPLCTDKIRSTMAQSLTARYQLPGNALAMLSMIMLAAAALITGSPEHRALASVQTTVTIRVVTAVRLRLDGSANPGAPPARDSVIKLADGSTQPTKLIEFQ